MAERMNFTLTGRDELSRVLNGTGDSADRLRLRLAGMTADADGRIRDLQGRFITADDAARRLDAGVRGLQPSLVSTTDHASKLGEALKGSLISLAPAAIPAAAGLAGAAATVAAQVGAAGLAVGAYGLALKPQVAAIGEVTKAQDAYQEAVATSGRGSQAAAQAQVAYQQKLAQLPPETQRAAVAVGLLRDNFDQWSDSLSGDVMGPFTKGVSVVNALLPKTTGLVTGASTQFDRLITMAGGAIATPGFDNLTDKLTAFSEKSLRNAVDELTEFLARLDTGEVGGDLQEFLDYCHAQGPIVGATLRNVGDALLNVLEAGSDVGVGMLQVINVLSGLVASVPPGAISAFLQLAIAIKAVKLAAVGMDALAAVGLQIRAMQAAATGTPGRLAGVGAAITGLSRTAKIAMAGTGLGLLLIGLGELQRRGKDTPPDVDKLTTSLTELGYSGKVSGEALKAFGPNLDGLTKSLHTLANPSNTQKVEKFFSDLLGYGKGGPGLKKSAEDIESVDKALAGMVSGGKAELAAAALKEYIRVSGVSGKELKELQGGLGEYKDALAGQALEQKLAAQSMGTFGQMALDTQAKLSAQKESADGLRQSIQALNDVNRAASGAMNAFEASIDDGMKTARENVGALKGKFDEVTGTLDLNTAAARNGEAALRELASTTDAATAAAFDNGASWEEVQGTYDRGREQFLKMSGVLKLTKEEAGQLADRMLKMPDKTAFFKGNIEDLDAKIKTAQSKVDALKQKRATAVGANKADLDKKVSSAQKALDALKQKRAAAITASNQTGRAVAAAKASLASIKNRTVTLTINEIRRHTAIYNTIGRPASGEGGQSKFAEGGLVGFPGGGQIVGPGTGTSDSILAALSNGEFVIRNAAVEKYGVSFLSALNRGRIPKPGRAAAAPSSAQSSTVAVPQSGVDVRALVAELCDAISRRAPDEIHLTIGNEPMASVARIEIRKANGELVQLLNAGGGN